MQDNYWLGIKYLFEFVHAFWKPLQRGMAGFGSGWWQRDLKISLGINRISLCSRGMLWGNGSDIRGQAETRHLVALGLLVGLVGVGRAGVGLHQGRN